MRAELVRIFARQGRMENGKQGGKDHHQSMTSAPLNPRSTHIQFPLPFLKKSPLKKYQMMEEEPFMMVDVVLLIAIDGLLVLLYCHATPAFLAIPSM
jgi:hypothetical protein